MTRHRGVVVLFVAVLLAAPDAVRAGDDDGFESSAGGSGADRKAPPPERIQAQVLPRSGASEGAATVPSPGAVIRPQPSSPEAGGESRGGEAPLPIASEVRRGLEFPTRPENRAKLEDLGIDPGSVRFREAILAKIDSGDRPGLRAAIAAASDRYPDDPTFHALFLIVDPHVSKVQLDRLLARIAAEGTKVAAGSGYSYAAERGKAGGSPRRSGSDVPRETLLEAAALSKGRQYDQVAALLTRQLKLRPNDAFLLDARTVARIRMGDLKGADEDSLAAVQLNAAGTDALRNRAVLMLQEGRYDESHRWAEQALKLDPLDATTLVTRAQYWFKSGRDDLALADYKKAAQIDPANYDLYRDAQERAARRVGAEAKAGGKAAAVRRAMSSFASGDFATSLREADALIAANPADVYGHRIRGLVFVQTRRFGEAILESNLALKVEPRDPYALLNRARALEALGNKARAEADYRLVDEIDPNLRRRS